jgi:2-amino-4-hydroxy-6-hydroxymethyldihydropteridine diphosphokinase
MDEATAFIGLGANLGDRLASLEAAIARLDAAEGVALRRRSGLYESAPVGVLDQPWFMNGVVEIGTTRPPLALLGLLKGIEWELGRRPTRRWGERTVDLDLLLYADDQLDLPELTVPHRELWNRRFVLEPLAELAPELRAPDGRPIGEVIAALAADQDLRPLARGAEPAPKPIATPPRPTPTPNTQLQSFILHPSFTIPAPRLPTPDP